MQKIGKEWKTAVLFTLFISGAWSSESLFNAAGVREGYIIAQNASGASEQSVGHALGEFRIVAANIIWLNVVDRYHHEFMEQGGQWSKNVSILPYMKIITWLDPHFVEAYNVGSSILFSTQQYDEGLKMLDEGIGANQENWQLHYHEAMARAWYLNDAKGALPYAIAARTRTTDPFEKKRIDLLVTTLSDKTSKSSFSPEQTHRSPHTR